MGRTVEGEGWYTLASYTRLRLVENLQDKHTLSVVKDFLGLNAHGENNTHGIQRDGRGYIYYRGTEAECETELIKVMAQANRSKKKMAEQYSKFSPITVQTKRNLKALRMENGDNMNEAAKRLGVSRKQLEDLETERNYGCHVDLEILGKYATVYHTPISHIVELHANANDTFYVRPRQRVGSAGRE